MRRQVHRQKGEERIRQEPLAVDPSLPALKVRWNENQLSAQIARLRLTRQRLHRVVYGSSTDDLDPVIVAKFVSDRGFGQKGLRLHHAGCRVCELARYSQHRSRVVSGAVSEIWRDLNRAEQNKRNEHGRPAVAVDLVAKSNKASFAPREKLLRRIPTY
jgi:hypothetical protein